MNMTPIASSHITHIGHEGDALHVTYKGGKTYRFQPVTAEQYNTIMAAESKGKALAALDARGVKISEATEEKKA